MGLAVDSRTRNMRLGPFWISALSCVNIERVPAGFWSIAAVIYSPARAIEGGGLNVDREGT